MDWSWEYLGDIGDGGHAALTLGYFGKDVDSFTVVSVAVDSNWEGIFSTDNEVVTRVISPNYHKKYMLGRTSYSVHEDSLNFYFFVNLKSAHRQHFIDTDQNKDTGYRYSRIGEMGAEYLIEDDTLYRYNPSKEDSDWQFDFVRKLDVEISTDKDGEYYQYVVLPKKEIPDWNGDSYVGTAFLDENWEYSYKDIIFDHRAYNAKYVKLTESKDYENDGKIDRVINYTYDEKGKLTSKSINMKEIYTYSYDKRGNIIEQNKTKAGDLVSTTTYSYTYDLDGNIVKKTIDHWQKDFDKGSHKEITYTYDKNSNLLSKSYKGNDFDENNNLVDEYSNKIYTYDASGNLLTENIDENLVDERNIESIVYTYDSDGNRMTLTSKDNHSFSVSYLYTYDGYRRVIRSDLGNDQFYTYSYDESGNLLNKTFNSPNTKFVTLYTYDKNNKVLTKSYQRDNKDIKSCCTYVYDKNGNLVKETRDEFSRKSIKLYTWKKL